MITSGHLLAVNLQAAANAKNVLTPTWLSTSVVMSICDSSKCNLCVSGADQEVHCVTAVGSRFACTADWA